MELGSSRSSWRKSPLCQTFKSCRVNSFSEVDDSILLDNVTVGRHAKIRRAIIDKDVEIPPGARIGFDLERDRRRWYVSEAGIVVIPKRAKIEPEG